MSALYERRVEQEWLLLQSLVEANQIEGSQGLIDIRERITDPGDEVFDFNLHKTQALRETAGGLTIQDSHRVSVHFPRFFPSVPMEASLAEPVFHPNVHPENGFVCLWGRFLPADTIVEAVAQLQRILTWQLVNERPDHLMQPNALAWLKDPNRQVSLPLALQPVRKPEGFALASTYARRPEGVRRRLS
jgi:hypothetical protein